MAKPGCVLRRWRSATVAGMLLVSACADRVAPELLQEQQALSGEQGSLPPRSKERMQRLERGMLRVKRSLERELRLRRRLTAYHQSAGLLLMQQKSYAGAAEHFSQALEQSGDSSMLFYYYGYVLAQQLVLYADKKREELARRVEQLYQRALSLDPKNSMALYAIAALYALESEQQQLAAQMLDRYLAVRQMADTQAKKISSSQDIKALFLRARVAYLQGQTQEALRYYRWIVQAAANPDWQTQAQRLREQLGG